MFSCFSPQHTTEGIKYIWKMKETSITASTSKYYLPIFGNIQEKNNTYKKYTRNIQEIQGNIQEKTVTAQLFA